MLTLVDVQALAHNAVDRLSLPRALARLRDEVDPLTLDALDDPGDAAAIPVMKSATIAFTVGGAETNTLADPTFRGQRLTLQASVVSAGARVVTVANAVNQTGNNTVTFDAAGETLVLEAIAIGANLRWRVVATDGATLSTV